MSRIWQEFYCGECNGYIDVKLNMALNYEIEMVCPNCGHEHRRCIVNGVIYEQGRFQTAVKDKIKPVKSAYHKEAKTTKMAKASQWGDRRDGQIVQSPRDLINESWYERYAHKV